MSLSERLATGLSWRWRSVREKLPQSWLRIVPHNLLYDEEYFDSREASATFDAGIIADSLIAEFSPTSCLDVGCGNGALLAALSARGVRSVEGLEYSDAAIERCRRRGVTVQKFNLKRGLAVEAREPVDLVTSFEVAEHLPAGAADRLVRLLTASGAPLVMSAAHPGQGGRGHLNEQPREYWIAKVESRGLVYDRALSAAFAASWENGGASSWYWQNVIAFRRRSG